MIRFDTAPKAGDARPLPHGRNYAAGGGKPGRLAAFAGGGPATTSARLAAGFIAASLAVLTFQSGAIAALHAAGAPVPSPPWSMAPVPPLGVPRILSSAFWGGLWGGAYALLEPRLTARLGWWRGGLAFGVMPLMALWFVVLPLKGLPLGGGVALSEILVAVVLHAVFGLATAAIFRVGRHVTGRRHARAISP